MFAHFIVSSVVRVVLDHEVYNPRHARYIIFYSLTVLYVIDGVGFLILKKLDHNC